MNKDSEFCKQWNWQLGFLDSVTGIIKTQLHKIIADKLSKSDGILNIRQATKEEDMYEATDMVMVIDNTSKIAVRLRRGYYNDVTFRSLTRGNNKTEVQKIQEGFCDLYFYGWVNEDNIISRWVIFDVQKLRAFDFDSKKTRVNWDGVTGFITVGIHELVHEKSIIACNTGYYNDLII